MQAQKTEKVKGNRMVSTQNTELSPFHTLILDDDFNVEIIYSRTPEVEIETDENLHDIIVFEVIDSVLSFRKAAKITSKKRLNIKVKYNEALKSIETNDKAEVLSLVTLDAKHFNLKVKGTSKVGLTVKSDQFNLESDDKSTVKLNVTSKNFTALLNGYSKLEALVNSAQCAVTQFQRATSTIEGACDMAIIDLDNTTEFDGKNFTINTCNIICDMNSDAYLEVLENITIEASGTSGIYLYENPKITINKLTGTSKLQKKEK
ncbi:DUF2807 domain-containing protein [Tamlana fucoidanivorans]|uniref:DUF2807 domain-containing protein n=2 Tax=Allotamlana fucoidanivorans TaxID=2583814 RepID=A0A5C4SPR1_9FLAO|nr:DUF2807 domain-containing protein [Tamlana fucoidanivorans]